MDKFELIEKLKKFGAGVSKFFDGIDLKNEKLSQVLMNPDFLSFFKLNKPIKLVYYDHVDYLHGDSQKQALIEKQINQYQQECVKAYYLLNFLILLAKEDKEEVNDFIVKNMTYVLDSESSIQNESSIQKAILEDNISQQISSILYQQQENQYIDISIQKKLIDFCVKNEVTKDLYVDYCEELEDYIFENYISLLVKSKNWKLEQIIIRNVNKIDRLTDIEDIRIAIQIIENALDYGIEQYNDEIKRCTYDKNKFNKVCEMISKVSREIPKTRDFIKTSTQEETINSLCSIYNYLKNKKEKNKKLVNNFNAIIKDGFEYILIKVKNKNILETAYKKIRNQSLEIDYAKEICELKEMIDSKYKEYVEEFKNSQKYSFEKYYGLVKTNLNKETDFYQFVKNKNFSSIFEKVSLSYKAIEIKDLLASNEYFYTQLQDSSEGCELTPFITCLIKAIEQFMCACIKYCYNNSWCMVDSIYDKYEHKLDHINWEKTKITCSPLKNFIDYYILNNSKNNMNNELKSKIIKSLENFIDKVRNGHFHKDNVYNFKSIKKYIDESYETISGLIAMVIYLEENSNI